MTTATRQTDSTVVTLPFDEELAAQVPRKPVYEFTKRSFDIVASLVGIFFFLPILPFLMAMVKLESSGPLFFRQERVGRFGRRFLCYKIRSMVVGAENLKEKYQHLNEATGAAFKIREDPRVTRVGKFVRRSSLDEYPQLFNVLKGDMSIIGPRPQIPSEVAQYTPEQATRLLVRPGVTCLWQIGGRNDVDFDEWMRLDREYVMNRGFKLDLTILLKTIPAVIARRGAY